jgi:AcrR family transcriptional regulator
MAARAGLNKAAVIEAAATLADAGGLEALTLAGLAERLGVRTPTLYHYVGGLAGLHRELALLGLRQQEQAFGRAVMGRAGADAIRALAEAYRAYVKAHPGVYAATVRSAEATDDMALREAQSAVVEIALRALAGYALAPDDAIHAVRMFRATVHGMATLELAGGFGLPQDVDETFRQLVNVYVGALEAAQKNSPQRAQRAQRA